MAFNGFETGRGKRRHRRNQVCRIPVGESVQVSKWLMNEGGRIFLRLMIPVAGILMRKAILLFWNQKSLKKKEAAILTDTSVYKEIQSNENQ